MPARTTGYVGPTSRNLQEMLRAPWLLSARDGSHTVAPRHIEEAIDEVWGERRLTAHWNGLLSGTGEA
eukprot:12451229-Alexandrium_andersonii.AAC.1